MTLFRKKTRGQIVLRAANRPDAEWHWRWQPAEGEAVEGSWPDDAPAHTLPDAEASLILLLPAGRMLFQTVQFHGRLKKGSQALLWPLEAFTLGDVEQLHLTVLQREAEHYHLAALDKGWLHARLTRLRDWGLQPERALPDVLALPCAGALLLHGEWLVRSSAISGFSAGEQETALLQFSQDITAFSPCPPELSGWQQAEPQPPLALLMQGAMENGSNLLHGEFAPPRRQRRLDISLSWRWPLLLGAACLLSLIAEPLLQGWQAQRQTALLQQQAGALYLQHFPAATAPAQPRQQLAQRLAERLAAQPQPGLLAVLAQSQPLLNAVAGDLHSLSWDGQRLTLALTTPPAQLQPLLAKHRPPALAVLTEPGDALQTRLHLMRNEQ